MVLCVNDNAKKWFNTMTYFTLFYAINCLRCPSDPDTSMLICIIYEDLFTGLDTYTSVHLSCKFDHHITNVTSDKSIEI